MKSHTLRISAVSVLCLPLCTLFTACEPNAKSGALAGAAAGAAVGIVSKREGDVLRNAVIGAGVGAAAGAIMKARRYRDTGRSSSAGGSYPTAGRTENSNLVSSPYGGHLVDVAGFRSGELAIDPKTNQVFRVP